MSLCAKGHDRGRAGHATKCSRCSRVKFMGRWRTLPEIVSWLATTPEWRGADIQTVGEETKFTLGSSSMTLRP